MLADGEIGLFGWPATSRGSPGAPVAIGVRTDDGNVVAAGARLAPTAIRQASRRLSVEAAWGLDWGDVPFSPGCDLANVLDLLDGAVSRLLLAGAFPVVLGGDHSISYASVAACQRTQDLTLVWFDAHTDFSAWQGTGAHNHKQVLRRIASLPRVQRIIQIGYRGYTIWDERCLHEKLTVLTCTTVKGAPAALLEHVPRGLPCYVSIDIDVLDPRWAPGTSTPVPGGLTPDELTGFLVALAANRRLLALDLVEVNPTLDSCSRTSLAAAALLNETLLTRASAPPQLLG